MELWQWHSINYIIYNNLTDDDYIKNYTEGFDELKIHAKDKTPEWASSITGINVEDIKKLRSKSPKNNQLESE